MGSYRIGKSAVKRARKTLNEWSRDVGAEDGSRLLTAATALALREFRDRVEWIQEPPPHTVIEMSANGAVLTYAPKRPLSIQSQPGDSEEKEAQAILAGHSDLVRPLQCLGLRALEGNLEWKVEPPEFP